MSSSKSTGQEKQKGKGKAVVLHPTKPQGIEFDDKPLWNHVKVLTTPLDGEKRIADKQDARMFYASALSFNLARLRTTLLAQEKAHVNRKLQPIEDSWKKKRVSICSDGWSDRQKRPLINIMAASIGGAMFVEAIDANNGSNFKATRLTIENTYPHIFWTPCVVHSLNLALKRLQKQGLHHTVMAKHLKEVKLALEKMVMDAGWKIYKGDGKNPVDAKAREVKQLIVNDVGGMTWITF
ncbi:hypothetical protein ACSBR1_017539 [Camellia fascicularis]